VVERFRSRPDFDRDIVDRGAAAFETLDDICSALTGLPNDSSIPALQ
jgi:hypothetical protein